MEVENCREVFMDIFSCLLFYIFVLLLKENNYNKVVYFMFLWSVIFYKNENGCIVRVLYI